LQNRVANTTGIRVYVVANTTIVKDRAMTALTFDERIEHRFNQMSPAEQRVSRFCQENREQVLITSAAAIAARTKTSDATVVRTSKALGFASLDHLRRTLAGELRRSVTPAERLTRTLDVVGNDLGSALEGALQIHLQSLESLRQSIRPAEFEKVVHAIVTAQRVVVFGLGPSSAIASYLITQLARFGFDTGSLTHTGLLFADDLRKLRNGDLVIMLAYGRVYLELEVLLAELHRRKIQSVLLTDTLASKLRSKANMILTVPRGRAEMLSMHTATLGLIEALLVGVASQRSAETLASLEELSELRQRLTGEAAHPSVQVGAKSKRKRSR
jgi:DNA-binding MurR/RpiR family transcriptional regulator